MGSIYLFFSFFFRESVWESAQACVGGERWRERENFQQTPQWPWRARRPLGPHTLLPRRPPPGQLLRACSSWPTGPPCHLLPSVSLCTAPRAPLRHLPSAASARSPNSFLLHDLAATFLPSPASHALICPSVVPPQGTALIFGMRCAPLFLPISARSATSGLPPTVREVLFVWCQTEFSPENLDVPKLPLVSHGCVRPSAYTCTSRLLSRPAVILGLLTWTLGSLRTKYVHWGLRTPWRLGCVCRLHISSPSTHRWRSRDTDGRGK